MKEKILILASVLLLARPLCAQEYKVPKSSGRLQVVEVNHVTIEGTNGNEVVFTSRNHDRDVDERAQGLRAISSLGREDNTGLGLSVVNKGDIIEVRQLKKMDGPDIKILVPKGVVVSYTHTSPYGEPIEIRNFEGEIEIATVHSGVSLTDVTGPVTVKTVHGDIDASFPATLKAPVRLESVHGHVDLALPVAARANLTLSAEWGEVLVDPDFKIELDQKGDLVNYSGNVTGKLNGGGTAVTLITQHNNVYLRTR